MGETARGVIIGGKKILIQADHAKYSPEQINKHELVHREYKSKEVQKAANIIKNSLAYAERQHIIKDMYSQYFKLTDGNEEALFEEFVCDVLSGMNTYGHKFDDVAAEYNSAVQSRNGYTAEDYAESIDAGGKYSSETERTDITPEDVKSVQSIGRKSVNDFTTEDIAKTESFAKKYYNELGGKSPFFRAWFGDWRANDNTPVHIVTEKGSVRGTTKNKDTGWDIQVSGKVFNETKSHNQNYNLKARPYLDYINSIVENAVLLDSHTVPEGKAKSENSVMMHSMYALCDNGNGIDLIKMYVEEMRNPNTNGTDKRSYQLQNIAKQQLNDRVQDKSLAPSASAADSYTISDLFKIVKQFDKNFNPEPSSKVVNEDGTPKVVYRGGNEEINIFDRKKSSYSNLYGRGFYFTDSKGHASQYGGAKEYYLDIKNPLEQNSDNISKDQMRKFLEAVAENEDDYDIWNYGTTEIDEILDGLYGKGGFEMLQDVSATAIGDLVEATELFNKVNGTNYDGFILPTETVVFNSNQIKSATDNIGTFDKTNPDIRYSLEKNSGENIFTADKTESEKYAAQIDNWLAGKMKSSEHFELGQTPAVLRELGADSLPVIMSQDVMVKITGRKHNISTDEIKNIPGAIADPIMVFKSATVDNAYLVMTELTDKSGNDVVVALHFNRKQGFNKVNRIASVYGKDNVGRFIEKQTSIGNLKYIDKNKSQEWLRSRGLRLPKLNTILSSNNNILQKEDIVNRYDEQNQIKYSLEGEMASYLSEIRTEMLEPIELERQLMYEIKEEAPAKRMTLNDLFEEYKRTKKYEIRESSYDKTVTVLKNHVIPTLGKTPLSKLTKPVLINWKNSVDEKTIRNKENERIGLSLKMKQNIYAEFRALSNFGVKLDYLPKNNLTSIGNFKSTLEIKKEMDYYTGDEFKEYIKSAREYAKKQETNIGWDYYVFFNLAFYTGARKGEIHALKWSDIDGNYLNISRSITQKLKGEDRETAPKNKSSIRTLQIPMPLIRILNDHKERYKKLEGFNDDFRICGGTKSLRDTSIQKMNEKFAKAAGIKTIRIHDFRHSHASLLANEGINIQEIARRLGHSNIEMTWNTYSHLYPREEERAIKILDKIV